VATLSVAFVAGQVDSARAQYYYQPSPDYYHNDTASGTIFGGAMGAVTGAIVGGKKDRGEGALIGAGVGALTGNLLGRSKDRADERRAAAGATYVGQMNQQAAATAITNYDLLEMTRAGVSEDVIISTMRARGARLDLSPQSLIALKQSGVSDRVVMAAQNINASPAFYGHAPGVIVAEPVRTRVYVRPAWHDCWHDPWCDPWYHHHHHHHHSRAHLHFDF
jgi:hypothetical protein